MAFSVIGIERLGYTKHVTVAKAATIASYSGLHLFLEHKISMEKDKTGAISYSCVET